MGLKSDYKHVAKILSNIIDSLDCLAWGNASGTLVDQCFGFKYDMIKRLREEGWRVSIGTNGKWKVLPPLKDKKSEILKRVL